ncbi:chain length determinant protein [Pontibacter sp. CAU 1760]
MYKNYPEDSPSKYNQQMDEVDLRYVFKKIGGGFKALFRKIGYIFFVMRKRALLLLGFVVAGLGVGYGLFNLMKPYYTSSMTLVLAEIRNDFVENQLNDLSSMIKEQNYAALAERLDLQEASAAQLKEMDFYNLDADRVSEDSVLTGSPFRIELSLYSNQLFESLEPALVNYLENNRYFSKQKNIRQREIESLLVKLKQDISSIDSIKTAVVAPRGPVGGFVYGAPLDPTTLYRQGLDMYEQQVELEAELDRLDNIQVVNGFAPHAKPTGPSLLKFLVISVFFAGIIGLVTGLTLESKNRSR